MVHTERVSPLFREIQVMGGVAGAHNFEIKKWRGPHRQSRSPGEQERTCWVSHNADRYDKMLFAIYSEYSRVHLYLGIN